MKQLLHLGLRLMAFALGAGLLIAGAHIITAGPVAAQARRTADEARREVLRAEAYGQLWSREDGTREALGIAMPDNVSHVSWGCAAETKLGAPISGFHGLVIELSVGGYGGAMELMIGVDAEGAVSGMRVLSHGETPGLGAKAAEADFEERLIGLVGPSVAVRMSGTAGTGVEAISGATITTRAVTGGLEQALELYAQLHDAMHAEGMLP